MLEGLMQNDFPLSVAHIRRRLRTARPEAEVVTLTESGTRRTSFAQTAERVDRLAHVLDRLGVERGERVGTLAWNNQRHFELYFAVPSVGAVLHTLNMRLGAEQLTYIINHAQDRVIFVDDSLVAVLAEIVPALTTVERYVVLGDGPADGLPDALRYDELLAEAESDPYTFPEPDEREAAALCYTSGTTGNPKGVLYSHRSIALHATGLLVADAVALSRRDRVLAVVPMFHVNAWGLPFGVALAGADLILPDRFLTPEPLVQLIEQERPTLMACVPTVFGDVLRYADEHHPDLTSLQKCVCGGAAVPRQLMEDFEERHGVRIYQAWGMTETSPLCTIARPSEDEGEQHWAQRSTAGRTVPWVELRLAADAGEDGARSANHSGEIEVRGPWVAASYYADPSGDDKFDDGWLRTGDIAEVDAEGFVRITDRSKDVIKSGGEWISSLEMESHLICHPDVLEVAVIAQPDERWSERPLPCVVLREGAATTPQELRDHLLARVPRWWVPDEFVFIDAVPRTGVGKFDKKLLRRRLRDGELRPQAPSGPTAPA